MNLNDFKWIREPKNYTINTSTIEIVTEPYTDLWQKTYYHFQNDNAPILQIETSNPYFSFIVKTNFNDSHHRFDQCGIVMYLDSENWLKASIEYENNTYQHLGSVVTNQGYSDWATTQIPANIKEMWYRFSRRVDDFCIECSQDGINFQQMRICHMQQAKDNIRFGIYACSPENSSFKAIFSNLEVMTCQWKAHDGQMPDKIQFLKDKNIKPTKSLIATCLGERVNDVYQTFCNLLIQHQITLIDWRYYNDGKAWLSKGEYQWVTSKGTQRAKPLFWISIWQGFFRITFNFSLKVQEQLLALPLTHTTKISIQNAKICGKSMKYIPVILDITEEKQLDDLFVLAQFRKDKI